MGLASSPLNKDERFSKNNNDKIWTRMQTVWTNKIIATENYFCVGIHVHIYVADVNCKDAVKMNSFNYYLLILISLAANQLTILQLLHWVLHMRKSRSTPHRTNISLTHTHTHTCFTALCPGLPGWARTRKVKPIWILLKQETVSGSGISWAICKSASRTRQITLPGPHHSVFYRPDDRPDKSQDTKCLFIAGSCQLKSAYAVECYWHYDA